MIRLTKIFDLLGNDTFVSIKEGKKEIYFGECGKCTRDIWRCAYIKDMRFDIARRMYNGKIILIFVKGKNIRLIKS